jgi:hypothetical protein
MNYTHSCVCVLHIYPLLNSTKCPRNSQLTHVYCKNVTPNPSDNLSQVSSVISYNGKKETKSIIACSPNFPWSYPKSQLVISLPNPSMNRVIGSILQTLAPPFRSPLPRPFDNISYAHHDGALTRTATRCYHWAIHNLQGALCFWPIVSISWAISQGHCIARGRECTEAGLLWLVIRCSCLVRVDSDGRTHAPWFWCVILYRPRLFPSAVAVACVNEDYDEKNGKDDH